MKEKIGHDFLCITALVYRGRGLPIILLPLSDWFVDFESITPSLLSLPIPPVSWSFNTNQLLLTTISYIHSFIHSFHIFSTYKYMAMAMAIPAFALQILLLCNLVAPLPPLHFVYNGFNTTNSDDPLYLSGAATRTGFGALQLTNDSQNVIGQAFYKTRIPMFRTLKPNLSSANSFSTYFVFQIAPASRSDRGGYGLAFILSPSRSFPGAEAGHFMGVFNSSNDGNSSNRVFMVEFDTVRGHGDETDADGNHVGINFNGMHSNSSKSAEYVQENNNRNTEDFNLLKAGPIQAWIEYDGASKRVNVTVCPLNVPKPLPLMTEKIDLKDILAEENVYAGFTAATGKTTSFHYILGWSFRLNGTADKLSHLPTLPDQKPSSSNASRVKTALIATFSVILTVLVVALLSALCYRRGMRFEALEDWELDCPHRFRYKDLHKATKGFKESEKIGVGGFGAVYRGVLPATGGELAVKKIMSNNPLQGLREFAAEIESLGRLRHKNLVNLQGWCKHKNDLLLVYDYVPNGSLDSLLYRSSTSTLLTWGQRFNIIKGIASGLLYLHEEWEQVVIHRDVKSSNVLIDRDMNARLGDFGLARLYDHGKNSHTTNVVGTIGYIAPELTRTGKASTGTDVFAYGILLLEVACGRAPVVYEADRNVILVDWVMECMQMGSIFDAVDARLRLNSAYVSEEVELVLALGLLCSHPKPEARPSMKQVMKYLNGDELLPMLDKLTSSSRREDEITSRLLALGLMTDCKNTSTTASTLYRYSYSAGAISTASFGSGR